MKALYPTSNEIPKLSEAALALKIARHSPCSICSVHICPGLRPPPIVQLVLDSVEDYDGSGGYLSSCSCGHDLADHGADQDLIGSEELARRGRVAVRIDELLQVSSRVLIFYIQTLNYFLHRCVTASVIVSCIYLYVVRMRIDSSTSITSTMISTL